MTRREYKCKSCGKFEVPQSIKDDILRECPACGADIVQVFSPEPLKDIWITDNPYVQNGTIHRILQKGGTSGFNSRMRS